MKSMRTLPTIAAALLTSVVLAAPRAAQAAVIEIDFSNLLGAASKGGRIAPHLDATPTSPVAIDAFYKKNGQYVQDQGTYLFVRNDDASDQGLGVCSPNEPSASSRCPAGTFNGGGGDSNELSNQTNPELIRLTLAHGFWDSVFISSLDTTEAGQLWGSDDDALNAGLGTLLWSFKSPDLGPNAQFALTGSAVDFKYLYFIPGPAAGDNDYLVWKVRVDPVPEPGTVALLAAALGATMVVRTKRRA